MTFFKCLEHMTLIVIQQSKRGRERKMKVNAEEDYFSEITDHGMEQHTLKI
jgi:hypothetical protein